jgi:hypothetical protein
MLPVSASYIRAQTKDGVNNDVFRSNSLGLTYTYPVTLNAKTEREIPSQDPTGREHIILALWSTPERAGVPRIALLYDSKVRPSELSRDDIAVRYLAAVRQLWVDVKGAHTSSPQKLTLGENTFCGIEISRPDEPKYNLVIAIPLKDRTVLAIQINAPTSLELQSEIHSLANLHFDTK